MDQDAGFMTTAIDKEGAMRRTSDGTAANDDHVGHNVYLRSHTDQSGSESGGWDAYEVWRRLIKEARDRRAGTTFPS